MHSGGKVGVDMLTAQLTCLVFTGSSYVVLKHDFSSVCLPQVNLKMAKGISSLSALSEFDNVQ